MSVIYDLHGNAIYMEEPTDTPQTGDPPIMDDPLPSPSGSMDGNGDAVYDQNGNRLLLVSNGYVDEGVAYFTNNEETLFTITGIGGGGGGGGGGGSGNNAVISVQNTSGWISKSVSESDAVIVSLTWSSIESGMSTGAGTMTVKVNGVTKVIQTVNQGSISTTITNFLAVGNNTIKITIADIYGNSKTLSYTVNVLLLAISSSFDEAIVRSGSFDFPYTANGNVSKHVMFYVDGTLLGYVDVITSGRQELYTIPAQTHGAHIIEAYFTADINGETVESNRLRYSVMCVESSTSIIISSAFNRATATQYETINIPYYVYDPESITTDVVLSINGTTINELSNVDRTLQTWTYRADSVGQKVFTITATDGTKVSTKSFTIIVAQGEIDVYPVTGSLALYLTSSGRTNAEAHPDTWTYENISAVFTDFNFVSDGWVLDKELDPTDQNAEKPTSVLRLVGDARVYIPYQIFGNYDFGTNGETIEFDFSTSNVSDYNVPVISCWSGERGLKITPQNAILKSENASISTLYKDNEHVRLTFVIEPRSEYRVIYCYINGIMSGAVQYIYDDDFGQTVPVGITIGSNYATTDIYGIRVYNKRLTRTEVLTNWIADTRDVDLMLKRYNHNDVYDNGYITTESLPTDLPYFIIEATELPQYKGDKKTVTGIYTDPVDPTKSFSFTGCQIDVQGTSSAPYYRKNYDMKFKEGFEMTSSGEYTTTYAIRTGSIPFNRFVIKADVASSESTNNTGLTMFYNTTCPYRIPEMVEDPRVRWGIEGVPIVLFWYNPNTGNTEFMGKYNFNLPKRAPQPYGYDPENNNDESWEWQRNNSLNVKFQDNDFTTQAWDAVAGQYYPAWRDDFEARFPEDTWVDTSKLEELLTWVKSTWRTEATNETLPHNVTYRVNTTITVDSYTPQEGGYTIETEMDGGVATGWKNITFTKDSAAYRLTKFRAELPDYAEIDSAVFYYLFTELFLMIDSRAKNMFIGFHGGSTNDISRAMDRKAVFEPYDMDTAIGTNNSGVLMFGYYLEDTDTVSSVISGGDEGGSNAPVFNAQDSVFWNNLRDAFRPEITTMYRNLRASTWSYDAVETMYENHQSKWCEAIFNEDAYVKYLVPLINPVTVDDATGELIRTNKYLTMLQGAKTEQRKWWLRNRFRYMDSKFVTGDASNTIISMRVFNSGTLTLTPATDLYVGVSFGGGTTVQLERTTAGTPKSFTYTAQTGVTEMETWLYSGDLLTDVGDLSVFYPNEIHFAKAKRLERLQLGNSASGYSNGNLREIDVSNCSLLKYIDCRNCPNLTQAIDLSNCVSIEEAYFEGTSITGVSLPNGGMMKKLHLPATVHSLIVRNQPMLDDVVIPDPSSITTLVLENVSTAFDSYAIVSSMGQGTRVRLLGIDWTIANADSIMDVLSTVRGVDENGNNTEYAQLTGSIHFGHIRQWQLANLTNRYPYLTITYDSLDPNLLFIYNRGSYTGNAYGSLPYENLATLKLDGVIKWPENTPTIVGQTTSSTSKYYFPDMEESIDASIIQIGASNLYFGFGKDGDSELINLSASSYLGSYNSTYIRKIYVPDDLVEDYKEATNWSYFADDIEPLSEHPYGTWGS